jgi:hypothetical protein
MFYSQGIGVSHLNHNSHHCSVLFGSEKFEAYVGDLAIATTAAKMFSNAEKHVAKGGLNTDGAKEEMLQHSDMAEKDKRQQVVCDRLMYFDPQRVFQL